MAACLCRCLALCGGGVLLLCVPVRTSAHNGAVAIAVPVEGITIDGDLSDWPEGMRPYPIALVESGVPPRDAEHYQGFFRLGYNEQEGALYLAVEVQDESAVIDTTATAALDATHASKSSDGCEVFLEVAHREGEGRSAQWVIWADTRRSFGAAAAAAARVEAKRVQNGSAYEWRPDLRRVGGDSVSVQAGTVIGFDIVAAHKDADGSFSWMAWGRGQGKGVFPERLGDVVLVSRDTPMGKLQGKVRWQETEADREGASVHAQSSSSPTLWVQAQPDSTGAYEVGV